MKLIDLGINSKTGYHDKRLTVHESRFLGLLHTEHVGKENKISADELTLKYDFAMRGITIDQKELVKIRATEMRTPLFEAKKRDIRRLHNHLLIMHDNISLLSKAGHNGGYWITEDKYEAAEFYNSFRRRGMTALVKASRGKKSVLVDMMEQVSFEFEDMAVDIGIFNSADNSGDPAAIAVVDAFLGRMLENPERFSAGLKKLSKKYGSILLDKTEVEAMKAKASELSMLVESLGV